MEKRKNKRNSASIPHLKNIFSTFMKTRRLVAIFFLLASLLASNISATADEKLNQGQTSLGNTTISGYDDSSADWELQPSVSGRHGGWWWDFMLWFGYDRR